jgi:hypothetical protein
VKRGATAGELHLADVAEKVADLTRAEKGRAAEDFLEGSPLVGVADRK